MSEYYNVYEEYGLKHYQLPKVFFTSDIYKEMDINSKVAWSILRDRFSISKKNNWFDENGRIFFLYSNDELMKVLNIKSKTTLQKIKKELINCGLLEQKRTGLNQPNKLYLKKPIVTDKDIYIIDEQEKTTENPTETTEVQKMDFQKYRKWTSRSTENGLQEVQKMDTSNTDFSNTDFSNTDFSNNHHLMQVGFSQKQAMLISKFAQDNKIKFDDDDFHLLVRHLMKYNKFNSIEYIAKAYDSLINGTKSIKVAKKKSDVLPGWFKNEGSDYYKNYENGEIKKSPDLIDQEREELQKSLKSI